MSRVHEVGFVLEQFVNALDDVPFSQHDLVPDRHKFIPHFSLEPMNELDTLIEQALEEFLLDISPVGKDLPIQNLCKHRPYPAIPIIHICSCKTERYHFAGIIAEQVQFESMAPTHGTLSVLGETCKDLVKVPSYIVTYRNHRTGNEGYTCTFAEGIEFHEQHHLKEHMGHEFHESIVGYGCGKITPQITFDIVHIIILESPVCAEMIAYHNGHYFTF